LVALFLLNACTGSQSLSDTDLGPAVLECGRVLYSTDCQRCHGDQQGVGRLALAPSHGSDGHTWHHPDNPLLRMVMDGTNVIRESLGLPKSEMEMPAFRGRLTEEEALAVLNYIKTWWTEEQRDSQAAISRQWEEANDR
jgi:mono/diheme cytochrome c family protein